MSVNKLLTLTAVGVASLGVATAALAGGPDTAPAPSYAGIYVEGNAGYALRNWLGDRSTDFSFFHQRDSLSGTSNAHGGFSGGIDVGYQFNQYFSAEAGWMYLPQVKGTFHNVIDLTTGNILAPFSVKITSGFAYAAGKGTLPIYDNTYVFGKLGVAYIYNRSSSIHGSSHSKFWKPMWAAGVQYYLNPNLSMNVQYMSVAGYHGTSTTTKFATPDVNLFTVGLGYKFLM